MLSAETVPVMVKLQEVFETIADWTDGVIHQAIQTVADELGLKLGKIAQPLRVIVTGGTVSPPIDVTLRLLGKERVLARLRAALDRGREAT